MIDCYCYYEPSAFYRKETRKAAKQHSCGECGRRILPGEKYEFAAGMWEGEICSFKTCSHCVDIRQFVKNSVPCFCWAHGSMLDDALESVREAYFRARDEVRGLFMGYGRLVITARRAKRQVAA